MVSLKHKLSYLILGQQGGENRVKIIELLRERPYNINQMSNELDLNYRTVKYHIEILLKHDIVKTSGSGGYGEVYFLTENFEENIDLFDDIKNKLLMIKSSSELFHKVIEQTHDGIIIVDSEKDVTFVNKSAEDITGYSSKDLLGNKVEFFSDDDFLDECIQNLKDEDNIIGVETEAVTKSGESIFLRVTIDELENDELLGYSIVFTNITEHKKTDKKIKKSEERYRRLFETAQDGMLILDAETGEIKDANPYILDLVGYSKEDLIGKELWEIGTFKDIVENKERFEELVEEGYIRYEDLPLNTKEGYEAPVEFISNTYNVGEEKVIQCNIRDITMRK
ncbi:MAG: PAS domain S-box protein [Thermoplasmatota archaeon]